MTISTSQIPLALALNFEVMKLFPQYSKKVMLVGGSGVGKTQSVARYAKVRNCNYIQLNLGQFEDVGDVLGLPYTVELNGKVYKKTAMDEIYKEAMDPDKNTVVFLDEVGTAPTSIKNALLTFLQEGKLGGLDLDLSKTEIVLATNDVYNDEYSQNDDSNRAFLGRVIPLEIQNTKEAQLNYFFNKYDASNPLLQFYLEQNSETQFSDPVKKIDEYIIETGRTAEDALMLYQSKKEAVANVMKWVKSLDKNEYNSFLKSINYLQMGETEFFELLEKTVNQLVRHTMSKERYDELVHYLESRKMEVSLNPSIFLNYDKDSSEYDYFMKLEGAMAVQATINLISLLNERYKIDSSNLVSKKESDFLLDFYEKQEARISDFQGVLRKFVVNKEISCDNFDRVVVEKLKEDFASNRIEDLEENTSLN